MKTIPLDLRRKILASYDNKEGTRDRIAKRFGVSLGMVKKLLQQRRRTADIAPRHHFSGRKQVISVTDRYKICRLLCRMPGMTLSELQQAMKLSCSRSTLHRVLKEMKLTKKDRRAH